MAAVVPVVAGISLEYYFSYVDPTGYGCGTKLPHNVTSLLGVMDGAQSDLRTGLPWQMVEIHEPTRLAIVVEAPPERVSRVLQDDPAIEQLVRNRWIWIACLDPDSGALSEWRPTGFARHAVGAGVVPWRFAAEPVGFVIQLGCFGYIALTRVFAQGRQLAAVEHEMRSAREIQHSILPRILPSTDRVRIAARYEPLAAVAGDFYDAVALDQGAVALLVADVSGHGVPAALIASMVKVAFAAALGETIDPAGVLERMNTTLGGMFERSYVTAACVFVEPDTRILKYALAGHPPPLIVNGNSDVVRLDQRGLFLGMFPSATYNTETITLEAGSRVLMYTDGVTETADRHEELFGIDRLMAFVAAKRTQLPAHFADALVTTLLEFSGRTTLVHDDVTILVADVD